MSHSFISAVAFFSFFSIDSFSERPPEGSITTNMNVMLPFSETAEHIMQGILVSGVAYYMQVWVIDKSGPVFLAMTMPITLLVTIILSYFLGEAVTLGRCAFRPSAY